MPDPRNIEKVLGTYETLYGTEMAVYMTQVQDKLVYTAGSPNAEAIKAQIDRIIDNKPGSLAKSGAYTGAVQGLPSPASAVMVFSLAESYKNAWGRMMGRLDPDVEKVLDDLTFDRPSAIGVCLAPSAGGVVLHFNIPMQEMLNVKTCFETRRQAEEKAWRKKVRQPTPPAE